jgi:hypothetical protein
VNDAFEDEWETEIQSRSQSSSLLKDGDRVLRIIRGFLPCLWVLFLINEP